MFMVHISSGKIQKKPPYKRFPFGIYPKYVFSNLLLEVCLNRRIAFSLI